MNKLLITGCLLATAFAAVAMPTKKELAAAQKLVEDVIAPDVKALNAGRKTVKDVADVQMKLAVDAQSEAEKYLLLQSAFKLYSRGEEFDSAAKALTAITRDIKDVPPELITELVDTEFNRDIGLRAPKEIEVVLLGASKANTDWVQQRHEEISIAKDRNSIESIFKGMIKVPGRDFWLSETELTQGQWESVMGYNLSKHKGVNLPVEMVSRNDCDVFLEKLNQTKEVQESQFEFGLPTEGEWLYAAQAGGQGWDCWIKPGVVGDILDMAWVKENSSNETHIVATKAANAFGFYDMRGNVWEWLANERVSKGCRRGGACYTGVGGCSVHRWIHTPRGRRYGDCGLRLAAHKKVPHRPLFDEPKSIKMQEGKEAERLAQMDAAKKAVDNVKDAVTTWMISKKRSMPPATLFALVKGDGDERPVLAGGKKALVDLWGNDYMLQVKGNRFAIISGGPDGKFGTDDDIRSEKDWNAKKDAVRQTEDELKRARKSRSLLGGQGRQGLRQTTVDGYTWSYCVNNGEAEIVSENSGKFSCAVSPAPTGSLMIPSTLDGVKVTSIGQEAFDGCRELTSVMIPPSVRSIGDNAFRWCALKSVEIPEGVTNIGNGAFRGCGMLTTVSIPSSVTSFTAAPFAWCNQLNKIDVATDSQYFTSVDGVLCTKDLTELVMCPNGLTSVTIPESVTSIGPGAFHGCKRLVTLAIPSNVKNIKTWAFAGCRGLTSVTIPASVTNMDDGAFWDCFGLTTITMCGERPSSQKDVFHGCRDLKSIHVPANAKSWAGMKEWQGIPLVFDAK